MIIRRENLFHHHHLVAGKGIKGSIALNQFKFRIKIELEFLFKFRRGCPLKGSGIGRSELPESPVVLFQGKGVKKIVGLPDAGFIRGIGRNQVIGSGPAQYQPNPQCLSVIEGKPDVSCRKLPDQGIPPDQVLVGNSCQDIVLYGLLS